MLQGIEEEDNVMACVSMGVLLAGGDGWLLCRALTSEFEIFFPILKAILGDGTPIGGKSAFLMCFFNMFELKSITKIGGGVWLVVQHLCPRFGQANALCCKWYLREASVEQVFWVAPCLQVHLQLFNESVICSFVRRGSQHPRGFFFDDASKHRSRVGRAVV